jgi:outer membrane autotransporter protein
LVVGSAGSSNSLEIVAASSVTVGADMTIGQTSDFNSVQVSGSTLSVTNDLVVGSAGSSNSLEIVEGGSVTVGADLTIGQSSALNSVQVSASTLSVTNDLVVGSAGSSNSLEVVAASSVSVGHDLTIGNAASSVDNAMLISASTLGVTNDLVVGNLGAGNSLVLTNSIANAAEDLTVGGNLMVGAASDNNSVLVYYSELGVISNLVVGADGSTNSFEVTNGSATVGNDLIIGQNSDFNSVLFDYSALTVNRNLVVGESGGSNSLVLSNSVANAGDDLMVGANLTVGATSDNNSVLVYYSELGVISNLVVGADGSTNSFEVVANSSATIGNDLIIGDDSDFNSFFADSSTLAVNNDLFVGNLGGGNRLVLTNSVATSVTNNIATVGGDLIVGADSGNNSVLIDYSTLIVTNDLKVGVAGSSNSLEVVAGSSVTVGGNAVIGELSDNNTMSVSGSDLTVDDSLYVGVFGGSNSFVVSNDATVSVGSDAVIGNFFNNNTVLVSDSKLSVTNDLVVGQWGGSSGLVVSNGATVVVGDSAVIGKYSNSNSVWITGDNTTLTADQISVGSVAITSSKMRSVPSVGSFNQLVITGNAAVTNSQGYVGVSGTSNTVVVSGTDTTWINTNGLQIGGSGAVGSQLDVTDGALVVVGNAAASALVSDLTSAIVVTDDGLFFVDEGGTANSELGYVVAQANTASATIDSDGAWNLDDALYVGGYRDAAGDWQTVENASNWNQVIADGHINIGGATIDAGLADSGVIAVDGMGSEMMVAGSNSVVETEYMIMANGATVSVLDGAVVRASVQMTVDGSSSLTVGKEAVVEAGAYVQSADATLNFLFEENADGEITNGVIRVAGTVVFEAGSTINQEIEDITTMTIDQLYTVIESDEIIAGSLTNDLSELDVKTLVSVKVEDGDVSYVRESLANAGGTENNGTRGVLDEIDAMGEANPNGVANSMLNIINNSGATEEELGQAMDQLYERRMNVQSTISQGRNVAVSQLKARAQSVRAVGQNGAQPMGAAGPEVESVAKMWAKGYGTFGNGDAQSGFSAYDVSVYGTIIGLDKTYGDLLLGVAGGYASSDMSQDDGDSSDIDTVYGMIYASKTIGAWYADLSLGYGKSSVDFQSGTAFGTKANYDAGDYAFYMGAGKQITKDAWVFTPEASLTVSYYDQDAYVETSTIGVPASVDAYDRWSYLASLGGSASYLMELENGMTLVPEVRAYWLHEFAVKDEEQSYTLVGGSERHSFTVKSPDEDTFEIGTGISSRIAEGLEVRVDLDAQVSENYESVTASGRITYEF